MPQARIRSVAASKSVTGGLQGQDEERCVWERCWGRCGGQARCRVRIRSAAAPRSVEGTLPGQDQERYSVWERYMSVAGAGAGALQRLGALQGQDSWQAQAVTGSYRGRKQEQRSRNVLRLCQ